MAEIKPAEISAILKKQISGFESGTSLEEVGTVLNVGDGIARVYGLSNVQYGELVEFGNGMEGMVLNLEEDNVGVILFGSSTEIKEGSIGGSLYDMTLERKAPGVIFRLPVTEPLQTGMKSVDAMIPVGRGQRELVIGDRQTGKTTVCIDTILNQKEFYDAGKPVYCI